MLAVELGSSAGNIGDLDGLSIFEGMWGAHGVMTPFVKCAHDGQHFAVMKIVVALYVGLRHECDRVPGAIVLLLRLENCASRIARDVCFDTVRDIVSRYRGHRR